MKNLLFIVAALMFVAAPIHAEETTAVATVVPVETVVADGEPLEPAPTEDTVSAEEVAKVEESNAWVNVAYAVLAAVVGAISSVVVFAGKFGIKKAEKALGFDIPDAVEEIAESYLVKAISWTEKWAKDKADRPSSENKMAETIRAALEKAGDNDKVKAVIDEKGKALVEKLLKSDDTAVEATPKE